MFLVSFLRDQATTHLWPALVLDRRGVRHEHRSDQTPKFGDLLGALLERSFSWGISSLLFLFVVPTLEFALFGLEPTFAVRNASIFGIARFKLLSVGRVASEHGD